MELLSPSKKAVKDYRTTSEASEYRLRTLETSPRSKNSDKNLRASKNKQNESCFTLTTTNSSKQQKLSKSNSKLLRIIKQLNNKLSSLRSAERERILSYSEQLVLQLMDQKNSKKVKDGLVILCLNLAFHSFNKYSHKFDLFM